ncbi:hypothetical protein HY498_02320 [Candidatus Woesearchaeota archaeon]|nr:hypothetical protein [Candidatus Woesearchaeota archaeon]
MVKNTTTWSLLGPLLYSKEFIHLSEIARKLKIHHTTLRKYLNLFEKTGVLIKKYQGRLTMYKLNYDNPLIIDFILLAEKEMLTKKYNNDPMLKEIASFVHNSSFKIALMFGSGVENTKKANDIDLVVINGFNNSLVKDFEKKFSLSFHIIHVKSLEDIKKGLKEEIKNKHLIIAGSEDAIKWILKG